jgi:hypothetical protein
MRSKRVLVLAAVSEAAIGVALLVLPTLVGRLLLGEELTGVAIPVARVTGIALIALGLACWPGSEATGIPPPGTPGDDVLQPSCNAVPRLSGYSRRMGRGSAVASGGDPRHFDDSPGSRMAQRSADQGIESIPGSKRPGGRVKSSRCPMRASERPVISLPCEARRAQWVMK